ncbi:M16 family metallopeptidase [Bacteroidota bacterium]
MDYEAYQLANGIRVVHHRVPNVIAHVGLIINAGSRDETEHEHGVAHFIEHMVFKGTRKRKAYHIISRLEDVGGEINAYTTKEETCVYASFLKEDYSRALELLKDIIFDSTFPEKEIKREKEVIIDEINSYLDNPGELIFDDFEDLIYNGESLGRNILGTPQSLGGISRKDILNFISGAYNTDEMVLCSVGDIPSGRLKKSVEKYFGDIPENHRKLKRKPLGEYKSSQITSQKGTFQAHCIIGSTGYDLKHERRIGLHLLNNILGGPGLNTRLNMSLRERNGYSYHTESHFSPYSDTGIISVYFSSDKNKLERSRKVVAREFARLRDIKLGTLQLHRAKRQLLGQIAISSENNETLMLSMAKSYLVYNKVDGLDEIGKKIEAISSEEILEIANEILDERKLSSLTYI